MNYCKNNNIQKSIIIFLWKVLLLLPILGQSQIDATTKSEQISIDEGLSQVQVLCMLKDSRGFLWFGTVDGLNRYDGYEIKTFRRIPSDTSSISFNKISSLYEDSKNNIWVGTYGGGLNKYNPRTEQFVAYPYQEGNENSGRPHVTNILEDENGKLWVGTRGPNSSIGIFDPHTSQFEYPVFTEANGKRIEIGSTFTMIDDHKGNIWAASFGSGLLKINKETKRIKSYKLPEGRNRFKSLAIDKNGMIWSGSLDMELIKFDPKIEKFSIVKTDQALGHQIGEINVIERKDSDNYWIGTSLGLFIVNIHTARITNTSYSFSGTVIYSLFDDNELLWVGTATGGVTKIIKARPNFSHFRKLAGAKSLSSSISRGVLETTNGDIWLGTGDGGINILSRKNSSISSLEVIHRYLHDEKKKNSISSNSIYTIKQDSEGTIWVGTYGYGLNRFDGSKVGFQRFRNDPNNLQSLSEDRIYTLCEDRHGNMFIGTETGALSVLKKKTQKFKRYQADENKEYHLRSNVIRCIQKDGENNIWLGASKGGIYRFSDEVDGVYKYTIKGKNIMFTASTVYTLLISNDTIWAGTDQGLFLLDLKSGKPNPSSRDEIIVENFVHLHESNSLPNNIINGILQDSKGNVWISTNKGLSRINRKSLQVRNFTKLDGLQDEFNIGSFAKTSDGYFIFGGVNGLTIFHPDSLRFNNSIPEVVITKLNILNESISPLKSNYHNIRLEQDISFTKKLELNYEDNIINLEFSALDYINPRKNQYAYKLEGFNDEWFYSGNRRAATYTNLDPGTYTFRVKGSNNDGVWNEEGTFIKITILPPYWATWWAYLFYVSLTVILAFYFWRRLTTRARLQTLALVKSAEANKLRELDTLKSRFFANISHEFRTPLTLILGPLEKRLTITKDEADKIEFSIMHRNASQLLTLINQLLDFSRLEAGTLKLQCQYANLPATISPIASQFSSMADSKKISFEVIVKKDVNLFYDLDKLEKIVTNVLSNAFKFTSASGIITLTINQHIATSNFKNGYAEIEVTDTGAGIGAEHLSKIFDRFYQVDMSNTRSYEGSGIGLSLTKELVELHHGTIEVQSELDKGSTFRICLPLGKDHLKPDETVDSSQKEVIRVVPIERLTNNLETEAMNSVLMQESILIIEDNSDLRSYMRREFQDSYKIVEAVDGEEGVALAIREIPTLVISDLMMPKKDGLSVCHELKEDERTSHIPIILLTAKADIDSKLRGYRQGADDYISKPFNLEELRVRIENLITLRKNLQTKFAKPQTVLPSEIAIDSADGRFLKKAVDIVEAHLTDSNFGVEPLANAMSVSQTQLYRKLHAVTGSGPNEFIRHIRLHYAANLLRSKSGNVSEVAYQAGFNNLSYFSKMFKEKFGVPPNEFLKNPPVAAR